MAESCVVNEYNLDPRTPCKYGSCCYRRNKSHLEKFKHPPGLSKDETSTPVQPSKKPKKDLEFSFTKPVESEIEKDCMLSPMSSKTDCPLAKGSQAENGKMKVNKNRRDATVSLTEKVRPVESKKIELGSGEETIKKLFLVNMPDDFYSFWEMCKTQNISDPSNALKDIKLKLVGPFDILGGKVKEVYEEDLPDFLRHWRFYYDPPEFQTVLASTAPSCYHIGYYRDDPNEMPVFTASNMLNPKNPEKNGELKIMGPNLFAALSAYLEELKTDPFSRMKVPKFQKMLNDWAKERGFCLEKSSKEMESRARKVVAKTFHGAGIVVPIDKKSDVGYRELAASNATIKKILKGIVESKDEEERTKYWEQLQPVMTFANIANDECDFGTSLELGLDLFSFGSSLFHRSILQLLPTAYNLLQRPQLASIIQAHLEDRKKGNELSIL